MGAATLAILAITIEQDNPLPLLGGVITGIGFLGAGALIRANDRVFGFTTAAPVWAMAALGVPAGPGPPPPVVLHHAPGRARRPPRRFPHGPRPRSAPQPRPTPPPQPPDRVEVHLYAF